MAHRCSLSFSLNRLLLIVVSLLSQHVEAQVQVATTTTGRYRGFEIYPGVHAYLGMRYAEPPVDDLRWEPSSSFKPDNSSIYDATLSRPGCYQMTYNTLLNDKMSGIGESKDCLFISVWKPSNASDTASLPVLVWIYGGGFAQGASQSHDGINLVSEHQDVLFVSFNYRLNIFGFPNSPAVTKNLGLRDQRLAIEWMRDNIASFGGDPSRITLAGQSAGSQSIAMYSYAYADDPIVSAFIQLSGQPESVPHDTGACWRKVANGTGCRNASSSETELQCLKRLPPRAIKRAISPSNFIDYADLSGGLPLADNETVFELAEYTTRGLAGRIAKVPTWLSHTLNEADNILPFTFPTVPGTAGVNLSQSDFTTLVAFHCPTYLASLWRLSHNVTTYRTVYSGSFPSLKPYAWMRAYHAADTHLLFGSEKNGALTWQDPGPDVLAAGRYYRGAVASFVRDPVAGLRGFGWPRYTGEGKTLVSLFKGQVPNATFEDARVFDAVCARMYNMTSA